MEYFLSTFTPSSNIEDKSGTILVEAQKGRNRMFPLSTLLVPFAGLWDTSLGPLIQNHWSNLFSVAMNSPPSLLMVRVGIFSREIEPTGCVCVCSLIHLVSLCVYNVQCIQREKEGREISFKEFAHVIARDWQSLKFSPWNLQSRPAGWNFQSLQSGV